MKTTLFILLISILMGICSAQTSTLEPDALSLKSTNADNISKLQEIYTNTPEIQITRSFDN